MNLAEFRAAVQAAYDTYQAEIARIIAEVAETPRPPIPPATGAPLPGVITSPRPQDSARHE